MIELTCFKIKTKKVGLYFLDLATFQVLNATCYGYVIMSYSMHRSDIPMSCVCVGITVMVL